MPRRYGARTPPYCNGNTGTAATPGTCNGNSDGLLSFAGGASTTGEMFQFWKQLTLAGLIKGSYTGISGAGGCCDTIGGTNAPPSKLSNAQWGVQGIGYGGGDGSYYAGDYGNTFHFGSYLSGSWSLGAVLKPEEAWNIDTKIDDGVPGRGKVVARYWNNACANSSSNTDYTGTYRLSDTSLRCALYFARAF